MLEVADATDTYLSHFRRVQDAAKDDAAWLLPVREAALAHFNELAFPTTKHEAWKYTNVAPIASTPFRPAEGVDGAVSTRHRAVYPGGRGRMPSGIRERALCAAVIIVAIVVERSQVRKPRRGDPG